MMSDIKRKTMFRASNTPYERLEEEPEITVSKVVEYFQKLENNVLKHNT